jgi:rhodanese-related sulfurtransferase
MKRLGVALVSFLVCATAAMAVAAGGLLSADDAARRAKNGDIMVIDVRSPGEWRQTGTAQGAKRVTIHDPDGADGYLRHMVAAVDGDQGRPIALICARGNRSTKAQEILMRHGFTNVHNIVEGMLGNQTDPGWIARGLPVVSCPSC